MNIKVLIALLLACLTLVSCDKKKRDSLTIQMQSVDFSRKKLMEAVDNVNKSCPLENDNNVLEGATFKDGRWTFLYTVIEDSVVTFDNPIQGDKVYDTMKESTRRQILSNPSMLTMLEALVKVDASLVYEFKGSVSDKVITVTFPAAELKVLRDVIRDK